MEMKAELVFIPIPEIGHFQSMLQLANHLVSRHHAFFVTFLTFNAFFATAPPPPAAFTLTGIRFINLPQVDLPQVDDVSGVDYYLLSLQLLKPAPDSAESYPPRSGPRRVRYQIPRLGLNRLDSDESTDIPS